MSQLLICRLGAPVLAAFEAMTFPVYRHLLALQPAPAHPEQAGSRPIQPLAFGAFHEGRPAGLVLGQLPLEPADGSVGMPAVLSVFVAPEFRHQGIAGSLLAALVAEVRERGFTRVEAVYTTGRPGSAAVEKILARGGWAEPALRTVMVHLSPREMVSSKLFEPRRLAALDPGFEIFPWADLPPTEREELKRSDEEKPWVTPGLWAWKYDTEPYDTAASVGARYQGKVVGWVIAQPINSTSVRYLASFLRKDLSRRGRILPLYRASLTAAAAAGRELATFVTPVLYPTMIRFIHKWFAPHARLVAETRGSTLDLTAETLASVTAHESSSGRDNRTQAGETAP